MQFHERLYELRKRSGMTQNDLAERMEVSRQAVSRWEMGTAKPDIDNLIGLSELYGVTLDYLIKGVEEQIPQSAPPVQDKPKEAHGKSNAWAGLMCCVYIVLWALIAVINFDPMGALITAGIIVGVIWLIKILVCAIIRLLRE